MRKAIHLFYKSLWIICFTFKGKITTFLFKCKLWMNNVSFGKNITSGNAIASILISKSAKIVKLGNNIAFNNYDGPSWNSKCCIQVKEGGCLIVGDNSGFNGVFLYCTKSIKIGKNVKVGGGSMIFDTDFHPIDYIKRRVGFQETGKRSVVIEDDVFIGTRCIICKGVTIGARSIVAAGSVVVKDIPSDEIWGGNPAKLIRKQV